MKTVKRTFATPRQALAWLRQIRPLFKGWEDNTRHTCDVITRRYEYPIKLQLPPHAVFAGLLSVETRIKPEIFLNPDPGQLRQFSRFLKVAEDFALLAWYRRAGEKREDVIGYRTREGRFNVQFGTGYKGSEIDSNKKAYAELFHALGLKVRFQQRGPCFKLIPPPDVEIHVQASDEHNNPGVIWTSLKEKYPGQALEQLSRLIRHREWEIIRAGLFAPELFSSFKGPCFPVSEKAEQTLDSFNQASLPIKKFKAEIWCTISAWDKLEAIPALSALDAEAATFELDIVRVKLGPKLDGLIIATHRKRGFEIGIYPKDNITVDEEAFERALSDLHLPG